MLKIPCFDLRKFAKNIVKLLEDEDLYEKISKDAVAWARKWDWDRKTKEILNIIRDLTNH